MRPVSIATSGLLLALSATTCASGQTAPPPAPAAAPTPIPVPTLPPEAPPLVQRAIDLGIQILQRNAANARNNARGEVSYFKRFDMQVRCGPNCYRNVRLHQGTIINPRGATPGVGTRVDVNGRTDPDGTLEADSITVLE